MTQTFALDPSLSGDADTICGALASMLEINSDLTHSAENAFWVERSMVVLRALVPALVWIRDTRGIPITLDTIRVAIGFQNVVGLAVRKVFRHRADETDDPVDVPVGDIPDALLEPLRGYLRETPGFDMARARGHEIVDVPARQHACVISHLRPIFRPVTPGRGLAPDQPSHRPSA